MTDHQAGNHYVVGFLFDYTKTWGLFIRKARPAWQEGRYNGIGGKIEAGEDPLQAMNREFQEETGIKDLLDWDHFLTMGCTFPAPAHRVFCYRAFTKLEVLSKVGGKVINGEQLCLWVVNYLLDNRSETPIIKSLAWIIPMAVNSDVKFASVLEREGIQR